MEVKQYKIWNAFYYKNWITEKCDLSQPTEPLHEKTVNLPVHRHIKQMAITTYKQWHCQGTGQMYNQIIKFNSYIMFV
jgi:hypothetical protein